MEFISGIFLTLCITSCQKKDNTLIDASQVVINISSPQQNQTYHMGDTIQINADVTYPTELHGYEVKITDTVTGFIVYDDAVHVHDDHFSIQDKWVNTATQPQNLKLQLIALLDHNGDDATKNLNFYYKP
jgi:hypothetical protein